MIPEAVRVLAGINARSYLELKGTVELPDGSNQGFWIDMFKQKFGGGKDWAWCMYTVQYILDEAYKIFELLLGWVNPFDDMPMAERGHCVSVWNFAINDARFKILSRAEILAGAKIPQNAIFILDHGNGTGHTGFVVSHYQNDSDHALDIIKTIEGNKSNRIATGTYTLQTQIDSDLKGVIF
jgi:hypothetical protein